MPGQAIVTIRDKQWQCAVANTSQELVSGLSGVESIPHGTGVLFDMGWDYPVIDIYTDEMLFAIDIIFINSVYGVVAVLRNVRPGDEAIFQGEPGACFFLEVNAGEAEGIEVGDGVYIEGVGEIPSAPSWITGLAGLIGFAMMGVFMVGIARGITEEPKERPALHGPSGERLLPQILHENGDIGLPLPFAGTGKDRLWWLATISGRTVTVEVTGISVLSQRQLENAFIRSAARISNIVTGKELPFAAATREKLRWLSTIGDKTVQVEVSGIRGLSERQMEDAFINSVAAITVTGAGVAAKSASVKKPTRHDVTVEAWQERDRLGIWITDNRTGKTIAEWWDEDAREMFEQGFFKPGIPQRAAEKPGRAFVESVLDYAESVGLLAGGRYLAQTTRDACYWTAVNKDTGEITESYAPYTSSGRALRGGKAFVSRHWQGLALVEVWRQPGRYSEGIKIEPVASERLTLEKAPSAIATGGKPTGTCYADAWRFVIREGEGELVHGTVFSGNRRIGHAWVETSTGWVWEPETGRYFTNLGFSDAFAPVIESRYTAEEAAIMAARAKNLGPWSELERRRYLKEKSPAIIPKHPRQPRLKGEIEFLPDSPEFLAYTIDDIGYREKIDSAFLGAIARARGGR